MCLLLPKGWRLALDPFLSDGVVLEVPVLVPVTVLQELQKRVAESGVHADGLSGVIRPYTMTGQRLFEKSLVVGATAIEVAWRCVPGREGPTLSARVMPGAKGVSSTVERAEELLASLRPGLPSTLEAAGVGRRREGVGVGHIAAKGVDRSA